MNPRNAWVLIGLCLVAFWCLDSDANQSESTALEGTQWTLVNVDAESREKRKSVVFGEHGKLELVDPNPQVVITPGNDYWELHGKRIILRVNDGFAVYEGEILDEQTMGGVASNRAGQRWEWRAHRGLDASASETPLEHMADTHDRSSVLLQQPQAQGLKEPLPVQQPGQPMRLPEMNGVETAKIEISAQETMSATDVQAAIDSGKAKKKFKHIGLRLWDISGYTDHSVRVYTPWAWVELQSFLAAKNHREVSLTEADVQSVLRVRVSPWSIPREPGSTLSPCRSILGVVLEDESRKNVLRPESEEKQTIQVRSKYSWATGSCVGILAAFSTSRVEALRALSSDAEFHVAVSVDADGTPVERVWRVTVRDFKKLP